MPSPPDSLTAEEVVKELTNVARRWREFGEKAELPHSDLHKIEMDCQGDSPETCLQLVLRLWGSKMPLTWEGVVKLLVTLREDTIAEQLAEDKGWFGHGLGVHTV